MGGYDGYTPARAKAAQKYKSQFCELRLRVRPAKRDKIQAYAQSRGESVNGLLTRLVEEAMERDGFSVQLLDSEPEAKKL